ncbi:MAG: phosphoethanolamine transferase [Bacteriovoracaceae bacterium]|jgi:glucan phosphoethanolaminetransferase (alkaline phosphatase superfamily)|nr:phosphoethanolamine transferase [Bacteriovoracaceae bacterium]
MNNLLLATTVYLITILSEFLYKYFGQMPFTVPLQNYVTLFLFIYIFSFIRQRPLRLISMNFIFLLSFFQMMHIQFYGMPVYPYAIYLLFAESAEVFGTLIPNLNLFTFPISILSLGLSLTFYADKKLHSKIKTKKWVVFIFIFYFIFNPARTFFTGNTWGRQPSSEEFMGTNIYLSLSYFLGRILPQKLTPSSLPPKTTTKISFQQTKPFQGNIIVVLGESLSANHLSLLGYPKITTPYLDSLKENSQFFYFRGISSGVSTDVAVAMFMNSTYGLGGRDIILKGKRCLFKLAKASSFETYFYSSQSQQQLRYITNSICPKYIDHYKNLEMIDPKLENSNLADDKKLIDELEHFFSSPIEKKFIILHQRGSHSPYKLRYKKSEKLFPTQNLTKNKERIAHYDNSVYSFDRFFKKLIQEIQKQDRPTLVIYLSDHGEGLGEEGVWGHAALKRPSIEIPILFYQHKTQLEDVAKLPLNPTHLNISLLISKLLGHQSSPPFSTIPKDYQILGNDIDGFSGHLETEFDKGELKFIQRKDI